MSASKYPTRLLGANGPEVSAIGLGTMGSFQLQSQWQKVALTYVFAPHLGIGAFYGKTDDEAAYKALTFAADHGVTFWDCADIYGTSKIYNHSPSHLTDVHIQSTC